MPVSQDPVYSKFFRMLKLGVPKEQLQLKLKAEGLDPAIIDMDPMAPSPGGGSAPSQALVPVDQRAQAVMTTHRSIPIFPIEQCARPIFPMEQCALPTR